MRNNILDDEENKQLESEKKKEIINDIVKILRDEDPNFYYMPTTEVASEINKYIKAGNLSREKSELVGELEDYDIQILLSLKN